MNAACFPTPTNPSDLLFASWLELAVSGFSLRRQAPGARVVVRLMDLHGRRQSWWGITLNERWLRGGNGAVTIFDSLPAAEQFLLLLKIDHFKIDDQREHGHAVAAQVQEVYTVRDSCNRCPRVTCGATRGQGIFHCPQLSQRRLAMLDEFPVPAPQRRATPVPA